MFKKLIPILYLPWWDDCNKCVNCLKPLKFISDCQKWCLHCHIIYTRCRYCLNTNVIFGITDQSQCRKCKRILFNTLAALISSGNNIIDELIYDTSIITNIHNKIANYVKNITKNFNPLKVYEFFKIGLIPLQLKIKWIPFSQITDLKKIAEGGFGVVYKANYSDGVLEYYINQNDFTWTNTTVAIKRFLNSKDINKYFLNEVIIQFST